MLNHRVEESRENAQRSGLRVWSVNWQVFSGDAHEIYLALLKERCERDGPGTSDDVLAGQFRLHLHHGIA